MVELESEGEMTRAEVAAFLREFADELDEGGREGERIVDPEAEGIDEDRETLDDRGTIDDREGLADEDVDASGIDAKRMTFVVGGDSTTVTIPEVVEFEVEVESRDPMLSSGVSQEIEFELSWELEDPDEGLDSDRVEIE